MTTPVVQEFPKAPGEIAHFPGFDFKGLLELDESFVLADVTVTIFDTATGDDITAAWLVTGSVAVDGTIVSFDLKDGTDGQRGDVLIHIRTDKDREYEAHVIVPIRARPKLQGSAEDIVGIDVAMDYVGASEQDFERVASLVRAASLLIERWCANYFRERDITLLLDGPADPLLDVGGHFTAVDTVKVGGVEVTDYVPLPERGQLYRRVGWRTPMTATGLAIQNVEVTLTVGYDPIPQPIVEAALQLVRAMREQQRVGGGIGDILSEKIGDYFYARRDPTVTATDVPGTGIPAFLEPLLLPYRRWLA